MDGLIVHTSYILTYLNTSHRYGCLGFGNSRFFARPLAELVTCQGRAILQSTVDLVQGGAINAEVGARDV